MKLIANWRKAPKMLSVQALAVLGVGAGVYQSLPPETVALIPDNVKAVLVPLSATLIALLRLIDQPSVKK